MLPCAEPYVQALEECGCAFGVREQESESDIAWYSSVDGNNKRMSLGDVTAQYWKDNLVSPVLFSQAIR
jgi:hybrid polyketide synthase/nonribosomal peptide synthetase ACE1